MHPILQKTFGGLSRQYYLRQFVFGLIFPAITLFAFTHGTHPAPMPARLIFTLIVQALLYPYSRFVYESIADFIQGDNFYVLPMLVFVAWKAFTMLVCWAAAIFIAPIGLAYLYYHHSRARPYNTPNM
jgi:hypothetical protein